MMRAGGAGLSSREGEPSRRGLMKTNYVLIDYDNVQVKSLALLAGEHFRVGLFLGVNDTRLPSDLVLAMHALGDRASYVKLDAGGTYALGFPIAYTDGGLAAAEPEAFSRETPQDAALHPPLWPAQTKPTPTRLRSVCPRSAQAGQARMGSARVGSAQAVAVLPTAPSGSLGR